MSISVIENESQVIENPFALEVTIVPQVVGEAGRACTTNDGCDPTCRSACTSSSC